MPNDRDTHFLGFAKLLLKELDTAICEASTEENGVVDGCFMCNASPEQAAQVLAPLIAQRAYDLVFHALAHAPLAIAYEDERLVHERLHILVFFTPDLTQWPESPITFQDILFTSPLEPPKSTD